MSTYGPFGGSSSFYSEPHPENVGNQPQAEAPRDEFANVNESPKKATPPPYTHYAPAAGDFAPSPMIDMEVQDAAIEEAAPPMVSFPLIAAGIFALWLIFKGDR